MAFKRSHPEVLALLGDLRHAADQTVAVSGDDSPKALRAAHATERRALQRALSAMGLKLPRPPRVGPRVR